MDQLDENRKAAESWPDPETLQKKRYEAVEFG